MTIELGDRYSGQAIKNGKAITENNRHINHNKEKY